MSSANEPHGAQESPPQPARTPAPPVAVNPLGGGTARPLSVADIEAFVRDELLAETRSVPVVAITSWIDSRSFPLDADALARTLGDRARVVTIETGEVSWALSAALPPRLDVYGGAARIWWPGLSPASDPHHHPLLFIYDPGRGREVTRRIIAAILDADPGAGRFGPWRPVPTAAPRVAPVDAIAATTRYTTAPARRTTEAGKPVLTATVTAIEGAVIRVRVGDAEGVIGSADDRLDVLSGRLFVGQEVPVFALPERRLGLTSFSTQGLLRAAGRDLTGAGPASLARDEASEVVVTKIEGDQIYVNAGGENGVVPYADVSLDQLAADVTVGQTLRVRRVAGTLRGLSTFSVRGLAPDPWTRLPEVYRVGDVVRGRVCRINPGFVLVEVLPGIALLAPISELEWGFVQHPSEVLQVGERVKAKILSLEPERRRGTVSIKQAYASNALPPVSPGPGQRPFLADEPGGAPTAVASHADEGEDRSAQILAELESALADRAELMRRLKIASDQASDLRKELRSAEDRLRAIGQRASGDLDPTASEPAFLTAVRVEYARRLDEGDRTRYPLQRMRIGREFLERLRFLDGISVEKVIEVCVQVACQRAHEVPAREVHQLRSGEAGAPTRVRARDNAKAWRCSLQDNTASARRLHWWDVPGEKGRTIEFASVAVHDDMSIPD